ncbi:MAG: hypothetical protein HZA84_03630 [Thaumarchaeota archaeon]|nr:hypothetical protein [Nitrososphaerota archaeon]
MQGRFFPFLRLGERGLLDKNGITAFGKLILTATELGISVPATIIITDSYLQHKTHPLHEKSCPVHLEILSKLRATWSKNRLKMVVYELVKKRFLVRRGHGVFLNHGSISKLECVKDFQDIVEWFKEAHEGSPIYQTNKSIIGHKLE